MVDVGKMIAKVRKDRGLSQFQLAEQIGMSKQAISHYETGKREPDYVTLEAIADILNVPITMLISEDDQKRALQEIYAGYDKTAKMKSTLQEVDFETAAIRATETLLKYRVSAAPVIPLTILKAMPGIIVVSFTEMADVDGLDSDSLVALFGVENQDAVTFSREGVDGLRYVVAYNQRLPMYMLQQSLAREIGHIILRHNVTNLDDRQTTEALYFARYLLCPRPLIKALMDTCTSLTIEAVGNITGCYGRYIAGISKTPGAHVPAEMNRKIREVFSDYIQRFLEYRNLMPDNENAALADFGSYMDNYEE